MQEQEHTPGPWTVVLGARRGSFHIPKAQVHEAHAAETDKQDGYSVSKANARLIAAAPDLLLALAWLHDLEQGRCPDEYADQKALAMAAARAAIVKATARPLPAPPAQGGDKTEDTLDGQ